MKSFLIPIILIVFSIIGKNCPTAQAAVSVAPPPDHRQVLEGAFNALRTSLAGPAAPFLEALNDFNDAIFFPISLDTLEDQNPFIALCNQIKETIATWGTGEPDTSPHNLLRKLLQASLQELELRTRLAHLDQAVFLTENHGADLVRRGSFFFEEIPDESQEALKYLVGRIFRVSGKSPVDPDTEVRGVGSGMLVSLNRNGLAANALPGSYIMLDGVMTCAHVLQPNDVDTRSEFYFVPENFLDILGQPSDKQVIDNESLINYLRNSDHSFRLQSYTIQDSLEISPANGILRNNPTSMTVPQHFENEDIVFIKIQPKATSRLQIYQCPVELRFIHNSNSNMFEYVDALPEGRPYFSAGYPLCTHYDIPENPLTRTLFHHNNLLQIQRLSPLFVMKNITRVGGDPWPRHIARGKIELNIPNSDGMSGGPLFSSYNEGGPNIIDIFGVLTRSNNETHTTIGCYWE